ncbi:voltage-gated potassium channel beta-2 subunit [Pseudohyphozyma bogoriensis]|nr:voltage-gated potassium channel beta-2 subunit [Pseudohyphozyma bogoriensis]
MIFRNLGHTGLKVPLFSIGGWLTLGGTVKGDPVKDILTAAWESGINCIDTAETYADGESEREIGRVLKETGWNRRELVIITKLFFGTGRKDPNQNGLSRKHLIEGMQDSLERLQLDYVDVVFAHRPDVSTPMEEVVRGFNHILDRGWAFYWGVSYDTSEWTPAQIEEARGIASRLGLVGPSAEQAHYSLLHRENFEKNLYYLFENKKYGSTIFSPLEFGLLTGKYNDGIPDDSRFKNHSDFFGKMLDGEEGKAKIEKVRKLTEVAKKLDTNTATLALAWAARNPHVSTVLLGASRPEQIHENLKALDIIPKLTPEILEG